MAHEIDIRSIRADDLRYLAAVADTGRLVGAARRLGVDHSTVSRRLRALETALGVRLVGRGPEGWVLTDEGRRVAEHARIIQAAVERAAHSVAGVTTDGISGTIRLSSADGFGARFVTPALTRLRMQHPGLNVELVTGAQHLTLRQTNFDIALILGAPAPSALFTEKLCRYDSAFYASAAYLAEHGDPGSAEELAHHPLIYMVDSLERVKEHEIQAYAPGASVGFASTNIFALLEAARQGAGVALLPKFIADTAPELWRVSANIPPARTDVSLALRKQSIDRLDVQAVRLALHQEVLRRRDELVWRTSPASAADASRPSI